jgi:hypothetical protein
MSVPCWAVILGDCGRGRSGEHYISDAIFDGEVVNAVGLSWCRDEPVTVGLRSAVAKILCARHNSALSDFDAEAAKLSRFLQTNLLDHPLVESSISLRGRLLEKWALKTFLNLGYVRGLHRDRSNHLDPPPHLVHYIFRDGPIADGVGLYFVTGTVSNEDFPSGLWWNVIQHPEQREEIYGMAFTFFGVRFVVSIPPMRAEDRIAGLGKIKGFDYSTAKIVYRPANITLSSQRAGVKQIHLEW